MTEEEEIPTAPYTMTLRTGKQAFLTEIPDHVLKKFSHKHLRVLKKSIMALCAIKSEVDRREYKSEVFEDFHIFRDYNIFQMVTHATLLAVNAHNTNYPEMAMRDTKREEEE